MADDEDIAALVVDNGSGMCKGECCSSSFVRLSWQCYQSFPVGTAAAFTASSFIGHHHRSFFVLKLFACLKWRWRCVVPEQGCHPWNEDSNHAPQSPSDVQCAVENDLERRDDTLVAYWLVINRNSYPIGRLIRCVLRPFSEACLSSFKIYGKKCPLVSLKIASSLSYITQTKSDKFF